MLARSPGLYNVFGFLWGAAMLAHQFKAGALFAFDHQFPLTIACVWLMLDAGNLKRLWVTAAIQILTAIWTAPWVTNHWLLVTFTNGTILFCSLLAWRRGQRDADSVYAHIGPPLRVIIVMLYVLVTLAKFTEGFFDPNLSCGVEMVQWLGNKIPLLRGLPQSWYGFVGIYGTIIAEGFIPLLLVLKPTRHYAIFFGWAFHMILVINLFFAFAMTMYAFYALFLPVDLLERWQKLVQTNTRVASAAQRAGSVAKNRALMPAVAVTLVCCAFVDFSPIDDGILKSISIRIGQVYVVLLSATCALLFFLCLRTGGRPQPLGSAFSLRGWAHALGPALVLFNGLNPYLGLKTENSFTMFANLHTEGSYWNHLILPKAMRVFHLQDDLVTVETTSVPSLQEAAVKGTKFVHWHFVRDMNDYPDASVTYSYRGERFVVPKIAEDPILGTPVNPILKKFIWFRPVASPQNNVCAH